MVEISGEKHDNIVEFPAGLDSHLARATRLSDDDRSPFGQPAYGYISREQGSAWASRFLDFRLPDFSTEDKVTLQIIGFSAVMTCVLMGIAFCVATAIVQVAEFF